jgi:uncharacterized membrane protein YphA (DoxX/SURF4 family)
MPHLTIASPATGTARTRRGGLVRSIALWTLQVLVAAIFAYPGILKLTGDQMSVDGMAQIGWGDWLVYFVGGCELAGAIGLLIPILSGLASTALLGLMIGAVTIQATVFHGEMVAIPAITGGFVAIIAWARRDQLARLYRLVTRR